MCVWGGGGGGGGCGGVERKVDGGGDSLISNCVCGTGKGEETGEMIHLFQSALKNLATRYFILVGSSYCPLWCSGLSYERTRN